MSDESPNADLFWGLAGELQAWDPAIEEGTIMTHRCLRYAGDFMALVDHKDSGLVVKLSAERVCELVALGDGHPFAPAGRVFKEWVSIPTADRERWEALLREAALAAAGRATSS